MRKVLAILFLVILGRAVCASTLPARTSSKKAAVAVRKKVFFSPYMTQHPNSLHPSDYLQGGKKNYSLSRKFSLKGSSGYFGGLDQNGIPQLEEYLQIAKAASVGLSYPLSSKLFLSGQYLLVTGQQAGGSQGEMQIPLFSALYRFSAKTSISIIYKNVNPAPGTSLSGGSQHTTAELQIHF